MTNPYRPGDTDHTRIAIYSRNELGLKDKLIATYDGLPRACIDWAITNYIAPAYFWEWHELNAPPADKQ